MVDEHAHADVHCPFYGRAKEDVMRELQALIENHLISRHMTYDEISKLSDIFSETAHAAVEKHAKLCPVGSIVKAIQEDRLKEESIAEGILKSQHEFEERQQERKEARTSFLNNTYTVLAILSAIIAVVISLMSNCEVKRITKLKPKEEVHYVEPGHSGTIGPEARETE